MRVLHHYWLSSGSRFCRILLEEKSQNVLLKLEPYWERPKALLALDPSGEVPIMVEDDGTILSGIWPIVEYLEEVEEGNSLLPSDTAARAEARRLTAWAAHRFERDVIVPLLNEKLINRLTGNGVPSSTTIRAAMTNLSAYLEYFNHLADNRKWMAGNKMTIADLHIAASLSIVDFMGDVYWNDYPEVKTWYSRIKSRPSFRSLLSDTITGMKPPPHYTDLDF